MPKEKDRWEFELSDLTLDDLVSVEEAIETRTRQFGMIRDLLLRCVTNKEPKDVKGLKFHEIKQVVDQLFAAVQEEMEIPKATVSD